MVYEDIVTTEWMILPTVEDQMDILREAHGVYHVGVKKMMPLIRQNKYLLPNAQELCTEFRKCCSECAFRRRKTTITPFRIVIPNYPLHHIYIDLAFLPQSNGNIGIVNLVDHLTKKLWTKVITNKRASTVRAFLDESFEDMGLKKDQQYPFVVYLRSDNGGEFVNREVAQICEEYGVESKQGPAYSPWVQGAVERVNQTIKMKVKVFLRDQNVTDWSPHVLPSVVAYNSELHGTTRMSPDDAWKQCFVSTPMRDLSNDQIALRSDTIRKLKERIWTRLNSERKRLLKNKQMDHFTIGQIVLIRVPKRYRTKNDFLWGRKGEIIEEQVDADANSLFRWRIRWLETGGFTRSETPGSVTSYSISGRDLMPFCLGKDRLVEMPTIDEPPMNIVYTDEDFDHDEFYRFTESAGTVSGGSYGGTRVSVPLETILVPLESTPHASLKVVSPVEVIDMGVALAADSSQVLPLPMSSIPIALPLEVTSLGVGEPDLPIGDTDEEVVTPVISRRNRKRRGRQSSEGGNSPKRRRTK